MDETNNLPGFISLDGLMQAQVGWMNILLGVQIRRQDRAYFGEAAGEIMSKQMKSAYLLLSRKIYNVFTGCWPPRRHGPPTKHVVVNTP